MFVCWCYFELAARASRTCLAASPPRAAAAAAAVGDCWRVGHAPASLVSKVACARPSTPRGLRSVNNRCIRRAFANTAFVHSSLISWSFLCVFCQSRLQRNRIKLSNKNFLEFFPIALLLLGGTVLSVYVLAISLCWCIVPEQAPDDSYFQQNFAKMDLNNTIQNSVVSVVFAEC